MTNTPELTAWMIANNFKPSETGFSYRHIKHDGWAITASEAAFFHAAQQKAVLEARIDECNGAMAMRGKTLIGLAGGKPAIIDTSTFEGGDKDKISAVVVKIRRDELQSQLTNLEKGQTE
jgi:hypothetical protein